MAVGAVIHVNVPAGIRAVVASSYRIPKLGEVDEYSWLLHAPFYVGLSAAFDVVEFRARVSLAHLF